MKKSEPDSVRFHASDYADKLTFDATPAWLTAALESGWVGGSAPACLRRAGDMSETWIITPDWPVGAEEPMDPQLVLDVLDQFSTYYDGAVASLSETVVPGEGERT